MVAHRVHISRFGALAATYVAVGVVVHLVHPDGWVGDASYLGVIFAAATLAAVGAWRRPGTNRLPWVLVAGGMGLSALADGVWVWLEHALGEVPEVSAADPLWLSGYVMIGLGLAALERRARRGSVDVDGLIDMAAVATIALLLVWQISVQATLADASVSRFTRTVWAAYPVADAALLALAVRLLFSRAARTAAGLWLGAGITLWLVADVTYLVEAEGTWARWQDAGWMIGPALLAAAAWGRLAAPPVAGVREESSVGWRRVALNVGLLGVPVLVHLGGVAVGHEVDPTPLAVATAVLLALMLARTTRIVRAKDLLSAQIGRRERRYRALAAHASDAVVVLDRDGRIGDDAPSFGLFISGALSGAVVGTRFVDVFPDDRDSALSLLQRSLLSPGVVCEDELLVRQPDGCEAWVHARLVNLLGDPDVHGLVVDLRDVTARKQAEQRLEHQALHDALTGLANRALFHDRVEHAVARSDRTDAPIAVLYLDLDGFKTVNDSMGHEAGDTLLQVVAGRIRDAVRGGDTVARLGGDEFAVLIESDGTVAEASAIAERILQGLAMPIQLQDHLVCVSASLGIATSHSGATASSLLRDADTAMYQAKFAGRARWVVFEPSMLGAATERFRLESDLAQALELGQLRLVYQPVVELESERLVGLEALLRWDHPDLGEIAPERFIPIAEETGLIVPIGRWVLETACAAGARWRDADAGGSPLTMAVNVSARQLLSPEFLDEVAATVEASGLGPDRLVIELTETVLVADPARVATQLARLRGLGVRIAIDDFGTGYSSLSYLSQFPVDILKIDRSFIATITAAGKVPALVRGLLELGHTLDLELVAEGVEHEAQRDHLREERCEMGQGFLFARPLDATAVEALLGARRATAAAALPR